MNTSTNIWSVAYIQLIAFEACCQFGVYLINPVVSNFAVALGASIAIGGFLNGLNPLASFISRPFAGLFFHGTDRRFLLLIAALVFEISVLLCALFPTIINLALSRIIMGVAFVIKSALVIAVASDTAPRESLGQAVGWIGLAGIIASALCPGIAHAIGVSVGYRFCFVASAILFAIALVLIKTLKVEKKETGQEDAATAENLSIGERFKRDFHFKKMFHLKTFPLAGLCFFQSYLFGSICGLLLLVGDLRGVDMAQFFFVYTFVAIAIRPVSVKLYDKYGLHMVFYPEAILMVISPLILIFAYDLPLVYAASVILALGQGGIYPNLQAESVKYVAPSDAALAANTFYIGIDVGMAVGPLVSGIVLEFFGAEMMFLTIAIAGIVFTVAYFFFYRWQRKMLAQSTETNGTNPII